jgi:two-component system, NtrC family, sensor kinase
MDSIRVLYVEGDPTDQEQTHRHLVRHAPHIKLTVVGTVAEAVERVPIGDMDVMLANYRLPDGTGLDLLDAVKSRGLEVPVVLVTGAADADVTVRLLKAGATDYLVKRPEYLSTLPVVLESAFRWFRTASERRRAPTRVLYAEHHREDMALTLRAFEDHDHRARVETVALARDALTKLKTVHYDVLLLDNRMPDLSGIEVLKELQAAGIRTPVVMVAGEGDEDSAVQAFKLGVADYLIKREGYLAKLPSTIENVLAQRRLADEKNGLTVLNDLAKSLITTKDLDEVLRRVVNAARELIKAEASVLWLFEAGVLWPVAWEGIEDRAAEPLRFSVPPNLAERLAVERKISLRHLLGQTGGPDPTAIFGTSGQTLAASFVGPEGLVAVLAVGSPRPREFTAIEERLLLTLADYAAVAVENGRLYRRLRLELEARERLTAILEATTDLVAIADLSGRLLYLNAAGQALLGLSAEDALGHPIAGLAPERLRPVVHDEVWPALIRDSLWTGEAVLLARDGRDVPVSVVAVAHRGADGTVEFLSAIVRDMTERKRIDAELRRQREALYQTEKLATMGTVLAGVAHELNNPLTAVTGYANLLRQELAGTPSATRAEAIAHAADRCASIVRNFLALARRHPPERQLVRLNDIARDAAELLAYHLRVDRIDVALDLVEGLPALWADPHQLHEVVVNLVTNARDELRKAPEPRLLTLRTRADAVRARVSLDVEDSGPGISAEIRDRIFEPFFTTKPVGQGTGLGLSLCHGIVESHGGTLSLVSEPAHGAIFRVELPVVAPPSTQGKWGVEAPAVVKGKRILVVDDERLVLQLLREMLGADHHTVDTVADGTQALEQLRRTSYDLILSDVRMPYLDGPGLYRALERRLPDLCRRFVLMTGDVLSAEIQTFLEQTGVPGLSKPFDRGEVRRVIQLVAGNKS